MPEMGRYLSSMSTDTHVIVVGGGPAGLTAAIALGLAGVETALVAPPPPPDARTTALLASSVAALETLGVWKRCRKDAASLRTLRLVDDTGRLLRAPEVRFDAGEIGLDAFGYNIANRHLTAALDAQAATLPALHRRSEAATAASVKDASVTVTLASGERIAARLAVGADGRQSLCRRAAGIATVRQAGTQSALALSFAHSRPHHDTSTEFHTPDGPFTTVPLPGDRSSLVWVLGPGAAKRIAAWDDATLSAEVERCSHSILGKTTVEPERGVFPLAVETAERFAAHRIALIGEAAHVIPPIGAQGLNLSLRDVADLAAALTATDRAPGWARRVSEGYAGRRAGDLSRTGSMVDALFRSLLADFLPAQALRAGGLWALKLVPPLRRQAFGVGMGTR